MNTVYPPDQRAEMAALWPGAVISEEGGATFILLPNVDLPDGLSPARADLLLCPDGRDGYASRLFFSARIEGGPDRNWNGVARILERAWWAFSWNIPPGLRLAQMVEAHLNGLRRS